MNFVLCYTQSWGCDWYLYVGVILSDFLGEALSVKEYISTAFQWSNIPIAMIMSHGLHLVTYTEIEYCLF